MRRPGRARATARQRRRVLRPKEEIGTVWNCAVVGQLVKLRAGWKPALLAGCHPAPQERNMFGRSRT
jgi:hypothetical protein